MTTIKISVQRRVKMLSTANYGKNNVADTIVSDAVRKTLIRWCNATRNHGTIIGGIAFSFYARPRATMDIDTVFLQETDVPTEVSGFKKIRRHCFMDKISHVEVEVLTPAVINVSPDLVKKVIELSFVDKHGIHVASVASIIALKLGRCSGQDRADIINLMKLAMKETGQVVDNAMIDVSSFNLSEDFLEKYRQLLELAVEEKIKRY